MAEKHYTAEQRRRIEAAYLTVLRVAELSGHDSDAEAAYKLERKQRGSKQTAEKLIAEGFLNGYTHRRFPAASAFYLSPGVRWAAMFGAAARDDDKRESGKGYKSEANKATIRKGIAAFQDVQDAWMADMRAEWKAAE